MEPEVKQFLEKLSKHIDDKNGLKISGQGMIAENTKKLIEVSDKIQKFCFFMEKRQTEMEKVQKEMLEVLKEIRDQRKD